jgi:hypothetical protein
MTARPALSGIDTGPVARPRTLWLTLAIFAVLAVIALMPIMTVIVPPLGDFPNHLARMYILHDGGKSAFLAQYYHIEWAILPNLAMDLIVPPLLSVLSIWTAGKLFLVLTLSLDILGIIVLHRAMFGRLTPWPLLGFLLLYNQVVLVGFVNFLFGVGLAFLVAAVWASLRRERPVQAVIVTMALASLVFFAHIEALMFLGILLLGIELDGLNRANFISRAIALGLVFVPAALLFLSWHTVTHHNLGWRAPWQKLVYLLWIFDNYHKAFDLACAFVYIGFFVAGLATGYLRAASPLKYWFGIAMAAFIASPDTVFGGASADIRLPLFLAMLPIAGTEPGPKAGMRFLAATGVVASLIFGVRMMFLEQIWQQARVLYDADMAALEMMPQGARLAGSFDWSPTADIRADIPQFHMPMLAVPLREAFVPTVFAYKGLQPLAITPAFADLPPLAPTEVMWAAFVRGDPAAKARVAPVLSRYDYIVFYDKKPITVRPTSCLIFVKGVPSFQLYKINRAEGACAADRL